MVRDRYINFPTNLLYLPTFGSLSLSSLLNLQLGSTKVSHGLQPIMLASSSKKLTHIFFVMETLPFLNEVLQFPGSNVGPKSFISNHWPRYFFKCFTLPRSSLVTTISFTFTMEAIRLVSSCLMKSVWSPNFACILFAA